MSPELPRGWDGTRRPFRVPGTHGVSGFAWGPVPPELAREVGLWLERGAVPGGQDLRAARVFRAGGLVAKFFSRRRLRDLLRPSAALRSAELHFRLRPIRTPRPLLAVSRERAAEHGSRRDLLVYEYVEGELLTTAWGRDAAASAELAPFLAAMHRRGIYHGDLHPGNLVWSGGAWVLLDVASLRGGLHRLFWRRHVLGQWARLVAFLCDPTGLRAAFDRYLALAPLAGDPERFWSGVLARAAVLPVASAPASPSAEPAGASER